MKLGIWIVMVAAAFSGAQAHSRGASKAPVAEDAPVDRPADCKLVNGRKRELARIYGERLRENRACLQRRYERFKNNTDAPGFFEFCQRQQEAADKAVKEYSAQQSIAFGGRCPALPEEQMPEYQ